MYRIQNFIVQSILTLSIAAIASIARAEVRVSPLISDHMVIQQGQPIKLSGSAEPGETIRASLSAVSGSTAKTPVVSIGTTKADTTGHWSLTLPARRAAGPLQLVLQATNRLMFSDVWIGEVWVASGQSNMDMSVHASAGEDLSASSSCAGLHWFHVSNATSVTPKHEAKGNWVACTPASVAGSSAVAFYFARELQRSLGVPIGIIQAAWGGTPAEAWLPRSVLSADPALAPLVAAFDEANSDPKRRQALEQRLREWESKTFVQDQGNRGEALGFAREPGTRKAGWQTMTIPQTWEKAGLLIDGVVWFQREVLIPSDWAGKSVTLSLGPLDDCDVTYWNGERIGSTGTETPEFWSVSRKYEIPARRVRTGRNLIAVRVFDRAGDGGFAGAPAQLFVKPTTSTTGQISLAGTWLYKAERRVTPVAVDWGSRPSTLTPGEPSSPTVLWNAMIAPLTTTSVSGVIWYQGESNVGRASEYAKLFPTLIRSWRQAWGTPRLPFLFVQLPNYEGSPAERNPSPGSSSWAELREAQTAALRLQGVAMAVTIDIGESKNIHPRNKYEVARRLAQAALRTVYGKDVLASGPMLVSTSVEGRGMHIRFTSVGSGLCTTDSAPPKGFMIAGNDRVWYPAEAEIRGESVIVASPNVANPVAVRYAWANDPLATLRNLAGLPAAPFRTDAW